MTLSSALPEDAKVFRREALTPYFIEQATQKIVDSKALKTGGHFIHHEGTPQEFHSTTWFYGDALFRDPTVMSCVIPGLVHKLDQVTLDKIELVVGVATGGAVMAREVAQFIQSDRPLKMASLGCMFLRHQDNDEYDLTNDDREWLSQWRKQHSGRSPGCLLLDDVIYSSQTTLDCVEEMRSMGLPVVGMLHVAGATTTRPLLIKDIPSGCLFPFDPGKTFKPPACPMCLARMPKTII